MSKWEDYITYEEDSDDAKPRKKPHYKARSRRVGDTAYDLTQDIRGSVHKRVEDDRTRDSMVAALFDEPDSSLEFAVAAGAVFDILNLAKVDMEEVSRLNAKAMEVLFMGYVLEYFERSEAALGKADVAKSEKVKNILERLMGDSQDKGKKGKTNEKE